MDITTELMMVIIFVTIVYIIAMNNFNCRHEKFDNTTYNMVNNKINDILTNI